MYDFAIIKHNSGMYIDSREVAEAIGKPHNDLMKAIRKYCGYLTAGNFSLSDFFLEGNYADCTGRTLPCFLLSKMGCEMVANKLTGEKGVLFTAAYVRKFNAMETAEIARLEAERDKLESEVLLLSEIPQPRLGEFNACARILVRAFRNFGATSEQIVRILKGIYEPLGISVLDDDEISNTPQTWILLTESFVTTSKVRHVSVQTLSHRVNPVGA
jgi:Rha family phage regulatory protein